MTEVVEETHGLGENGVITEEDFRDLVFANPASLYAETNPDFFKGTAVEVAVATLLLRQGPSAYTPGWGLTSPSDPTQDAGNGRTTMAENADSATGQGQETAVSSAPPEESSLATAQRSNRIRYILLGLLIIVLAVGAPYGWQLWQYYRTHESTDDAYVIGNIIPISARVSGTILSVLVEENQPVEAGQLLAQLDPRDFETKVQQAGAAMAVEAARMRQTEIEVAQEQDSTSSDTARTSATLRAAQSAVQETRHGTEEAQARLRTLGAAVTVARAEVDARHAHLDMARTAFERAKQLLNDGVVAQQQYDEAQSTLQAAEAERRMAVQKLAQSQREVEQARVELRTKRQAVERAQAGEAEARALLAGSQAKRQNVDIKQAEVDVIRALLQQKQADLDYAKLQLDYTMLRAPVAGVVAKKNLEIGQVVQAGRPLLAIVPLQHVWVEANFKETQLRDMRPGQPATLKVDAYPGAVFYGTIESISPGTGAVFSLLPPENATGNFVKVVQRIPVKIVLNGASPKGSVLRPGMSVIATVATQD